MAGRVFLIDYENVHGTGLYGIDYLDEEDYVYLFFTDQANKLELNFISDIQVPFFVRRVPCGKQSLDMHLVSYLGYLIGSEPSNDCRYFIISKDTDFDGVCEYWSYQFCIDDIC